MTSCLGYYFSDTLSCLVRVPLRLSAARGRIRFVKSGIVDDNDVDDNDISWLKLRNQTFQSAMFQINLDCMNPHSFNGANTFPSLSAAIQSHSFFSSTRFKCVASFPFRAITVRVIISVIKSRFVYIN